MSLITINIKSNDVKLDEILILLKQIGIKMTVQQDEFNARIAALAAEITGQTSIITSIATITTKVFDEVKKLVDANGVLDMTALAALEVVTVENTRLLAVAAAANTSVDELIPDAPVV